MLGNLVLKPIEKIADIAYKPINTLKTYNFRILGVALLSDWAVGTLLRSYLHVCELYTLLLLVQVACSAILCHRAFLCLGDLAVPFTRSFLW